MGYSRRVAGGFLGSESRGQHPADIDEVIGNDSETQPKHNFGGCGKPSASAAFGPSLQQDLVDDVHQLRIVDSQRSAWRIQSSHQLSTGKASRACANNSTSCCD